MLISPQELHALLNRGEPVFLADCSFDLFDPSAGYRQFTQVHIAGARHIDLDRVMSAAPGAPVSSGGRHPLPLREVFAQDMAAQGLRAGQQVVVYDRQGANYCGRLWWMLKWCGHANVAVLDGGLPTWQTLGLPTADGPNPPVPDSGDFAVQPLLAPVVDAQTLLGLLGQADLPIIDARASARFRGETEPLDPVAGHIPGAINRPFADNLGSDGRFKPAAQLREEFEAILGQRAPALAIHHCGSGVSAIPNVLAMSIAGWGITRLFPGSWSEWCATQGAVFARERPQV